MVGRLMDVVVVGGGPWSPDTNFPTHHTARILSQEHRVLYLCRSSHVSLLGQAAGRLPGFHTWRELLQKVVSKPLVTQVNDRLWVSSLAGGAALFPLSYPPFSRTIAARLVAYQLRAALNDLNFELPLLWFYWWFFPELVAAIRHSFAVYDIYDDHAEYDYVRVNPKRQAYSIKTEQQLLDRVDLAFAVSQKLVRDKSGPTPVHYLPNGVDVRMAESAARRPSPDEVVPLPRPIVGYLGSYDSRLDWSLVEGMVQARPSWSFVFVGGGYTAPSRSYHNLHLLGNRPYPEALAYVNTFDLALIPFVRDALTEAICPAKLFDYLALGKPILSTPLPAVQEVVGRGEEVYRGETIEDFLRMAENALHEPEQLPERRRALARSLTWEHRSRRAMDLIRTAMRQDNGT